MSVVRTRTRSARLPGVIEPVRSAYAEIDGPIECRELKQPLQSKRHLQADAVQVQREQDGHRAERIAADGRDVVGRQADLDARLQELAELDDAELRCPAQTPREPAAAEPRLARDCDRGRTGDQRLVGGRRRRGARGPASARCTTGRTTLVVRSTLTPSRAANCEGAEIARADVRTVGHARHGHPRTFRLRHTCRHGRRMRPMDFAGLARAKKDWIPDKDNLLTLWSTSCPSSSVGHERP
jgi:hypothetical protein